MVTQAERREATRRRLVAAARACFAADGYEHSSTERIRQAAGVSRGAMYHHFRSKLELFEAVFTQVSDETIDRAVRGAGRGGSALADLVDACLAWLREVRDPEATAILLEQGPQVLGWKRARELEAATSLGLLTASLERAAAAGEIDVVSVPLTAQLLDAVLAEAALAALSTTPPPAPADVEQVVRRMVQGLAARSEGLEPPTF